MKKLCLFFMIFIGLISLSSCEEKATITIVGADGVEQKVEVVATDDKETVTNVLKLMSATDYSNIKSFTMTETVNLDVQFTDTVSTLYGIKDKKAVASLESKMNASEADGFDLSVSGNVSAGDIEANGKAQIICNSFEKDALMYVDASAKLQPATGSSAEYTYKKAINPLDFIPGNDEGDTPTEDPDSQIPAETPDTQDPIQDIVEGFDVNILLEFYEEFPNSKIEISNVKKGKIFLKLVISYKDIISNLSLTPEQTALINQNINVENTIDYTIGVDSKTGRIVEMSLEFTDAQLINFIIKAFVTAELGQDMIQSVTLSAKTSITYDNANVKVLTEKEKAQYALEII